MAYLARKLYLLKKEREKKNLKIGRQDSMMLEAANRLIVDELSIVYNVKSSEIEGLIDSKIKK